MTEWLARVALLLLMLSCTKVPIYSVGAGFTLADASWFEEEQTLFVFYEVHAEQGLGEPSVIEITYATDNERVDWTPIHELPTVHTHLPVDCGVNARCGSTSLHVVQEPRDVRVRLRYHRRGELSLDASTVFNLVGPGSPHTNRSLLVYGVFDETNTLVQWRARHTFPTVRNERATELGLRREFSITLQNYGNVQGNQGGNPYSYGVNCPANFRPSGLPMVRTKERAVFNVRQLPLEASDASVVCATSSVPDAVGVFVANAVARKNPQVLSAFPILRSPVEEATQIQFFLGPCNEVINSKHEAMQRQRLFMENVPTTCTDDWNNPGFVNSLVVAFRDAVEAERPAGNDMVLVVAVHQDAFQVAAAVEDALDRVVPPERHRTTPRLAGAFVFDSTERGLTHPELAQATLWCPSTIPLDEIPDASARSCAVLPDIPELVLGPLTVGALPILPTREQYLDFVRDFSVSQAGKMTSLTFLAPEFAATADHVDLGEFGVVTFLNGEAIAADQNDAFSYCVVEDQPYFVVRSALMRNPDFQYGIYQACAYGYLPEDICQVAELGLLPIQFLPDWHNQFGESAYQVGVFWEFPFLTQLEYKSVLAGAVGVLGFSVPFGVSSPAEAYYGTELWLQDDFQIDPALTQCKRFCDHPTFDSAGVYHIRDFFRPTYANNCYVPRYPVPGDSGFPFDP